MSLLVSTAKDEMLYDLNSVGQVVDGGDIRYFLNKSVDYFFQHYAFPTAEKKMDIIFYPYVTEYALETDFDMLIPPRKPDFAQTSPVFHGRTQRLMHTENKKNSLSIAFDDGTPYLKANVSDEGASMVFDGSSIDNVTLSGDGSGLKLDDSIFVTGSSSILFSVLASTGSTAITIALDSPIDISNIGSTGRAFLNLQCPSTNSVDLTSVKLRLGNDASNYYEWTKTQRYRGNGIGSGWGIIGAQFEDMALLTEDGDSLTTEDGDTLLLEGTVDPETIDYIQIIITHGTTGVDGTYRLDSIFTSRGTYYELPYYSKYIVKSASGTYKEKITADDDTIILPPKTEEAVKYKALELIASLRIKDPGVANYFARELEPYELAVKARYPKQELLKSSKYY